MIDYSEYDKKYLDDVDEMNYEIANLTSRDTGLSNENVVIRITTKREDKVPFVRVSFRKDWEDLDPKVEISISREPEVVFDSSKLDWCDIEEAMNWVKLNYEQLIEFWNEDYEQVIITEIIEKLEKIK